MATSTSASATLSPEGLGISQPPEILWRRYAEWCAVNNRYSPLIGGEGEGRLVYVDSVRHPMPSGRMGVYTRFRLEREAAGYHVSFFADAFGNGALWQREYYQNEDREWGVAEYVLLPWGEIRPEVADPVPQLLAAAEKAGVTADVVAGF